MTDLARLLAPLPAAPPWFARLGRPLTGTEAGLARAHILGLGLPALDVVAVPDWDAARGAVQTPADGRDWWAAEERMRRALLDAATARHGREPLLRTLSTLTAEAAEQTMAAAEAARDAGATAGMVRAAAGAAAQAVYLAGLALAAGHGDGHPFAVKLRLFAAGRWPLGVVGDDIMVF